MNAPLRILCTGDVHLGRRPSRIPIDNDTLSVTHVWKHLVNTALDRTVDAVVLTGDIVDQENKRYEAYGPLEQGVRQLGDAGIDVVAVAGNHDHDTFPRLARSLDHPHLHVLGRGGTWESFVLTRDDAPVLHIVGWSFPQQHITQSPLDNLDATVLEASNSNGNAPELDLTTLGVMHADAGASASRSAPVSRSELARTPVDAWLLGHIHAPDDHREGGEEQLQLYPGSLQPLDPGETGSHGAWLLRIPPTGTVEAELLPLASLRYEHITVDISGCDTEEDVDKQVLKAMQSDLKERVADTPDLAHIVYRLIYEGRTALHRTLDKQTRAMMEDLAPSFEGTTTSLDAVDFDTRPDHDLAALAESNDPPGVVAQRILALQNGDLENEAVQSLLRASIRAADTVYSASGYTALQQDDATAQDHPGEEELRHMLIQQGMRLLDELRSQHPSPA